MLISTVGIKTENGTALAPRQNSLPNVFSKFNLTPNFEYGIIFYQLPVSKNPMLIWGCRKPQQDLQDLQDEQDEESPVGERTLILQSC